MPTRGIFTLEYCLLGETLAHVGYLIIKKKWRTPSVIAMSMIITLLFVQVSSRLALWGTLWDKCQNNMTSLTTGRGETVFNRECLAI